VKLPCWLCRWLGCPCLAPTLAQDASTSPPPYGATAFHVLASLVDWEPRKLPKGAGAEIGQLVADGAIICGGERYQLTLKGLRLRRVLGLRVGRVGW
jgi:hypothetical protein